MELVEADVNGRSCWIITCQQLRLTVSRWGAQLAAIELRSHPGLNPLWIPPWPTIDADRYHPPVHELKYGGGSEARLLSGILGHNLCFPFWGNPTEPEFRAGMTFHGEAGLVQWHCELAGPDTIVLHGDFPESALSMNRQICIRENEAAFSCTAQNHSAWDRPVAWCEHVTFGPPFLNAHETYFEASAGQGFRTEGAPGELFRWPHGEGEIKTNLARFSGREHRDLVNSFLVDSGNEQAFFRAANRHLGLQIEYRFSRAEFAWLNIWENHDSRMLTRGMEFSNTPRHGTMRTLVQTSSLLGTPVYDWIEGKGNLAKTFSICMNPCPQAK